MIEINLSDESTGVTFRMFMTFCLLTKCKNKFRVRNIRTGRPKPGLNDQSCKILSSLRKNGFIKIKDFKIGDKEIELETIPTEKTLDIHIETMGSIWLIFQVFTVPLLVRGGKLMIRGTNLGPSSGTLESTRKVLYHCGLLKFFKFKFSEEPKRMGKLYVQCYKPAVLPTVKISGEMKSYKYTDAEKNYFLTSDYAFSIDKEDLMWQIRCQNISGFSPYFYDQWLYISSFIGGDIEIPPCVFEINEETGKRYDNHSTDVDNMSKILSRLMKCWG